MDGVTVADQKRSNPAHHPIRRDACDDESFDLGVDTRSPVDDNDYQLPFRFTGTIDKLTVKVGPPQI